MTDDQTQVTRKKRAIADVVDAAKQARRDKNQLALSMLDLDIAIGELIKVIGGNPDNAEERRQMWKALRDLGVELPGQSISLSTIERALLKAKRDAIRAGRKPVPALDDNMRTK